MKGYLNMKFEKESKQDFEGFDLQIIKLETEDIITTSGPDEGDNNTGDGGW